MESRDKLPMIPVAVLFVFVCVWCVVEVWRNARSGSDPVVTTSSAGWKLRRWFYLMLLLANFARAVVLVLWLSLPGETLYDESGFQGWKNAVAHIVPDLLYITTYSLLIMFWAQLYYSSQGISYATLKPGFMGVNVVVYAAFAALATITAIMGEYDALRSYSFWLLGSIYIIGTAGMLYYGLQVAEALRPRTKAGAHHARKMVLRRVLLLCSLCSTVFVCEATYCFVAAVLWKDNYGYPDGVNRYTLNAVVHGVDELLPSILILILTRKKTTTAADEGRVADVAEGSFHSSPGFRRAFADSALSTPDRVGLLKWEDEP